MLVGRRASRVHLFPLTWWEISQSRSFDFDRYLMYGSLPRVYLSDNPVQELHDYVDIYLREEVQAEARVRNLPVFIRFLKIAGLCHGELLNYARAASDLHISANTVKDYFSIWTDTLLGFALEPWRQGAKRKSIETSKYYLFDTGIVNTITGTKALDRNSNLYGRAFETFIINEVRAYCSYKRNYLDLSFWRTTHQDEVDLIVGDKIAIEIKSTSRTSQRDIQGLNKIADEHKWESRILVSQDPNNRAYDHNLYHMHWETFVKKLSADELIVG